jgi:prevent-host-death family protein
MRRTISTQGLKASIGDIVDRVRLSGDRYIVERRGTPVAAIVPLSVNESYEQNRERLFALVNEVHNQNRTVSSGKIDAAIAQAVMEVRQAKRKKPTRR